MFDRCITKMLIYTLIVCIYFILMTQCQLIDAGFVVTVLGDDAELVCCDGLAWQRD